LIKLNINDNPIKNINFSSISKYQDQLFITNAILESSDGCIWVGTWGNGLIQYSNEKGVINHFKNIPNNSNSLINNSVITLCEDYDGNIWIGTNSGICIFNKKTKIFSRRFLFDPNNPNSLSIDNIKSIILDKNKDIWVATWGGGINKYIRSTNSFKRFSSKNATVRFVVKMSGPTYPENLYLAGSMNGWNPSKNKMERVGYNTYATNLPLSFGNIEYRFVNGSDLNRVETFNTQLSKNKNRTLWVKDKSIVLDTAIFELYSDESYKIIEEKIDINNTLISENVWTIRADNNNNIWIGTDKGLCILNPITEKIKNITFNYTDSSFNSDNSICFIYIDKNKNAWLGTFFGGLNFFNTKTNQLTNYTAEKDGLSGNRICGILEDNQNNIWVSTNRGLSKVYTKTKSIENIETYDILSNYFYRTGSCAKFRNSELVFGGSGGLTLFNPNNVKPDTLVPKVLLTDLRIFNQSVPIGKLSNGQTILKESITSSKEITLSYQDYAFTIEFAGLYFSNPQKVKYAYMLEGFDKKWTETDYTQRIATYTNLNEGTYIFKVRAYTNINTSNTSLTSIKIIITPPYWKTWWFITLVTLLILISGFMFYYIRVKSILKHKRELEILVKARTQELEERNFEIMEQNEEIRIQVDLATRQRDQISEQNVELELHRHHLENLVQERTRELVEAKEKAEEADRLKTAFLANMSHEIRTPMNSILGFINLLDYADVTDEEREQFKEIINTNSQLLLHVIDDILDIAKIESGELKLKMVICNINEILNETYNTYKDQVKFKNNPNITFSINNVPEYVTIISDKLRLKQVINNLIENAIKYTEKGFIKVDCTVENKYLKFAVSDSGIGISKENTDIIFDRFRKIENVTEKLYRGTGLGLSISRKIVEMLAGQIWVESDLGIGSSFYFTMPYQPIEQQKNKESETINTNYTIPDLEDKTILVAEDEDSNYIYIQTLLKFTRTNILRAKTGTEAVDACNSGNKIDLILMDIKMPDLNGIDATHEIKRLNNNILVIAQTAFAMKEDKAKYIDLGFDGYISKPIKKEELFGILNQFLK
jgi:signal transduction histidine kinase/CheY-like chemotaxis protein